MKRANDSMRGIAPSVSRAWARAGLLLGTMLVAALLGGCGHNRPVTEGNATVNTYPANYKADILGAMHAYLDDPTGIRDAAISDPAIKPVAGVTRYTACLKFNAKRNGSKDYAGSKEIVAVFQVGRFDRFIEPGKDTKDICSGAAYGPFPELEKLPP
jgi:hypothetical protein